MYTPHVNHTFIHSEMDKNKDYQTLGPDRDCNTYEKIQGRKSLKYENFSDERTLKSNLANQLQEISKYENAETDPMTDFKSDRNFGDSLESKLYESKDNYNTNSSFQTESTTYAEIE